MVNESDNQKKDADKKTSVIQSDPETLHTTDPQENMQGPVSSIMQNIKEAVEKDDEETKEEADQKKDKNM